MNLVDIELLDWIITLLFTYSEVVNYFREKETIMKVLCVIIGLCSFYFAFTAMQVIDLNALLDGLSHLPIATNQTYINLGLLVSIIFHVSLGIYFFWFSTSVKKKVSSDI